LKRDEVEEEREGAKSLAQVEVEKVEAMDRRERHDEAEEEEEEEDVEAEVEVVEVEAKEGAKEARRDSMVWANMRWIRWGWCFASRASMWRIESSGMSMESSMAATGPGG
jgi:hypothetical protein